MEVWRFLLSDRFWLPGNYTWQDLKDQKNNPQVIEFSYPILLGFGLWFIRALVERLLLEPLGVKCGLSARKRKSKKLKKFCDSGWRFICYFGLWAFGLVVLLPKEWFGNSLNFWKGFPLQGIDDDIWWYYTLSAAFYWSLLLNQASEERKKDFWMMCVHHMVTLSLIYLSWMGNFTRVGSVVILIHDLADIFIEISKMFIYTKQDLGSKIGFTVFTVVWILTRIIIYPCHILRSVLYEPSLFFKEPPVGYVFYTLLFMLFAMHMVWTYFILLVCSKAWKSSKIEDSRSSDEDSSNEKDD